MDNGKWLNLNKALSTIDEEIPNLKASAIIVFDENNQFYRLSHSMNKKQVLRSDWYLFKQGLFM